jgi:hypothetical protein
MYLTSEGGSNAPLDYVLMKYRERFKLSWHELMQIPLKVVMKDIEMISLEEKVLKSKQDKEEKKHQSLTNKYATHRPVKH